MQTDNNETNSKISNELTIEPGLGGSMLNAGFVSGANVGKSQPLMLDVETDDASTVLDETPVPRKRASNATNLLLAAASAVTGVNLDPMSMIPRKYLRERKHYDPKYDPDRAAMQQAHNFALEQARAAKKAYKKSVPRSERVLPKGK